jgi:hypothetical protein
MAGCHILAHSNKSSGYIKQSTAHRTWCAVESLRSYIHGAVSCLWRVAQLVKKFPAFFAIWRLINVFISACHRFLWSQINPISILYSHLLKIHFNIIIMYHYLSLDFTSDPFYFMFSDLTLTRSFLLRTRHPSYLIPDIAGKECTWITSSCIFLHPVFNFYALGANISLSTLFSNTHSLFLH